MKKILAMALVLCMVFALTATASAAGDKFKVGMVTDVGGVNDKSFNQTTYEASKAFCDEGRPAGSCCRRSQL